MPLAAPVISATRPANLVMRPPPPFPTGRQGATAARDGRAALRDELRMADGAPRELPRRRVGQDSRADAVLSRRASARTGALRQRPAPRVPERSRRTPRRDRPHLRRRLPAGRRGACPPRHARRSTRRAVTYLVNSHLHFDHTGGNHQIPNARLVVQRRGVGGRPHRGGDRRQLLPAARLRSRDTTCSWSTASTISSATAASSACRRTVTRPGTSRCGCATTAGPSCSPPTPATSVARSTTCTCPRSSTTRRRCSGRSQALRALRAAGAQIVFGHDPEFWDGVPQAPAALL